MSRKSSNSRQWRFSVAPMMAWTDRHCRAFHRLLSNRALLYTEMVTTGALLHGDVERHLAFGQSEHPVALQLGGSDPAELQHSAKLAQDWGYDEVNLNVGCPSDRVQRGKIGACLMGEPQLVADCVAAMRDAVDIPVTVKCRIGIDRQDAYEPFAEFIDTVSRGGCEVFIVHARKAWLDGLSPKENREVPPLRYDMVYRIKRERPDLTIVINGGIDSIDACNDHLRHVDGVMLGRAAYQRPWLLAGVDSALFGDGRPMPTRDAVMGGLRDYAAQELAAGTALKHVVKPVFGLYHGQPGGRMFRRVLSESGHAPDAGLDVLDDALAAVKLAEQKAA
ncbi:tRNA dihydrouridine(20/20a) synthase DusA [bacterium]|nr:tRNA dihydrouridine(20/20a) synthase DusA [bacterium]